MPEEFDRTYNVPLGRAWIYPKQRRSKRAVKILKNFAVKHGESEQVKISEEINELIWDKGIRNPPRKIKVRIVKDKEGLVTVETPKSTKKEETKSVNENNEIIDIKPEIEDTGVKKLPKSEDAEIKQETETITEDAEINEKEEK